MEFLLRRDSVAVRPGHETLIAKRFGAEVTIVGINLLMIQKAVILGVLDE